MNRVVIVGAGISGLALAYRLLQLLPATDVTVLEQLDRVGGTIWTERRDGFQVELGPNGFLDNKPSTIELCHSLGLGPDLVAASEAASRNRYLLLHGRLQPLPHNFKSFLTSSLLSWRGKLSVLAERFRRRRELQEESVEAFFRRRLGREAAELFADALVTGIQAGDPALLSLNASFPRLAEMEREHGGLLKGMARAARERRIQKAASKPAAGSGNRVCSFSGGLRVLVETLAGQLKKKPVLGVSVASIEKSTGPGSKTVWTLRGGGESWQADALILTCPAYRQAELLKPIDRELAQQIGSIRYSKVAVVALGYRRGDVPGSLAGFGYIAPQSSRRDALGVQWCSSIFPERAPPGTVLLRAMAGGWNRSEILSWPDERLLDAVRGELRLAMEIEAAPVFHKIVRWDNAIPQYQIGHLSRVSWIEDRVASQPGLFLGGNSYRGIALNDCTEQAYLMAHRIGKYFQSMS